jgi:hypothetical protein
MAEQIRNQTKQGNGLFRIADQNVEIEVDREGLAIAYLSDDGGNRLLSYTFRAGKEPAVAVLDALGVEVRAGEEAAELEAYLRTIAA